MNDSYFKDPEFFYQLFDKETWKNTDKIVSNLYFTSFKKTAMDTGDWYESMIYDSESFQRFSEEQDLIAIRNAHIGYSYAVDFLLPIKTIDAGEDFVEIEFSRPNYVYQLRDYNFHQDIRNYQSFFGTVRNPATGKTSLIERCLNLSILSKKKNLSFDFDEFKNKCREYRDIHYFEDHYYNDNNFRHIFEYWEKGFTSKEHVYIPYDEMSVHETKYNIPNNDKLFKQYLKVFFQENKNPEISPDTNVHRAKKRSIDNDKEIVIDQEKLLEELSKTYPEILTSDGHIVPYAIIELPKKFRAKLLKDFNIAIEVVEYDGEMLQYLCHEFKNNLDIVSVAALKGGLEYADPQLKKNKEFALEILNASDHYMFEHNFHCFAEDVQNDIEILSLFLAKGFSLDDTNLSITDKTARSIVQQNGKWIGHLPKQSRENKEVILQALKNNPGAEELISSSALEDESFHLKLLSLQIIQHFSKLPVEALLSRAYVLDAVSRCGLVLKHLNELPSYQSNEDDGLIIKVLQDLPIYRADKEIVLAAVKQNGWSLQYVDNALRDEKEIVVAAVTQNGLAIKFASDSLKRDKELIDLAIRNDYFAIKYIGLSLIRKKEILNNLIEQGRLSKEISNEILGKSSQAEYLSKHPNSIDLNKSFIQNGAETFMIKVSGDSMINANIFDQSILIVDRSIKPKHDSIVVASLDGEFVCKRLQLKPELCLLSENPQYQPIYVQDGEVLDIQGTVTASINQNL